jgi:hypothetical protein
MKDGTVVKCIADFAIEPQAEALATAAKMPTFMHPNWN